MKVLGLEGNINDIKKEYEILLDPIKERFWHGSANRLTCASIMVGSNYGKIKHEDKALRILYVGRAMNGWEYEWEEGSAKELVEQIFSNEFDMKAISRGVVKDENDSPIYNYNRSQFWQLCRQLMKLYNVEEEWSDYVAWTNLFKVSPFKGKNPNNKLIRETIESCANILESEIRYLKPSHIIFVTGSWWYQPEGIDEKAFSDVVGVNLNKLIEPSVIIGSGISKTFDFSPKVVITERPDGINILRDEHAKAIYNEFLSLDKI
jgi:hypothetical protein